MTESLEKVLTLYESLAKRMRHDYIFIGNAAYGDCLMTCKLCELKRHNEVFKKELQAEWRAVLAQTQQEGK